MNYSQASIANLALGRIGARGQIVSLNENSPNAVKVLQCWDAVFQEVLSERDWKFAKTRAQLQLAQAQFAGSISGTTLTVTSSPIGNIIYPGLTVSGAAPGTTITGFISGTGGIGTYTVSVSQTVGASTFSVPATPLYTYRHAWAMPGDFLRFVRPQKRPHRQYLFFWGWSPEGWGWYHREDPPFLPLVDYKIEQVATNIVNGNVTYTKCAITNYGGCSGQVSGSTIPIPASITYIQLITDYTQLMPGFVNCLAWRLAKELAISITEDKQKFELMEDQYKQSLNSAEAQNETNDLVAFDEDGSTSWVDAGRRADWW